MPRVVRRQSILQRIVLMLNPFDHLLQLSTEIDALDWDSIQVSYGTPIGIALNFVFAVTLRCTGKTSRRFEDDVFAQPIAKNRLSSGASHLTWVLTWGLALLSLVNAIYCFTKKKRYRLFEQNILIEPATSSARLVRVESTPTKNSPMRILSVIKEAITDDPSSRVHPDETRDVWEIGVWDPAHMALRIFTLFSPVHVAVYALSFPLSSSPQYSNSSLTGQVSSGGSPITIIITVFVTQMLISLQLYFIAESFKQQAYDNSIINKQVMTEYNTKYVHPRLNVIKRDVAVQTHDEEAGVPAIVKAFTPDFHKVGFKTNANPNYAGLTMQDKPAQSPTVSNHIGGCAGVVRQSNLDTSRGLGPKIGRPQFERLDSEVGNPRRSVYVAASTDSAVHASENLHSSNSISRTPTRQSTSVYDNHTPNLRNPTAVGMNGLVNWHTEQNRHLSPSMMSTPLGKSGVRPSTYAGSLGTPLGTPVRRRNPPF